jgi:hypothetical protein
MPAMNALCRIRNDDHRCRLHLGTEGDQGKRSACWDGHAVLYRSRIWTSVRGVGADGRVKHGPANGSSCQSTGCTRNTLTSDARVQSQHMRYIHLRSRAVAYDSGKEVGCVLAMERRMLPSRADLRCKKAGSGTRNNQSPLSLPTRCRSGKIYLA